MSQSTAPKATAVQQAVESIVEEYEGGERSWEDPDTILGCDLETVLGIAESELANASFNWGEDAAETLEAMHPEWGAETIPYWSCPCFTGHSGCCGLSCNELAWRAHFQP